MPDLRQTRKKLKVALAIMAGLDLLALGVYFSPLVGSAESRHQEIDRLQSELKTKNAQVAPLKDLDKKVKNAHEQIVEFYKKRFPSQDSQIPTQFGKLAAANGVTIEQAKYTVKDASGNLRRVEMEADLSGNYTSLAKFINAVERDEMFFIINSVSLGGEPQGTVKLNVKLETYLKAGS